MKIAIIGYSGSGKSTLAENLSKRYSLPIMYIDRVHWLSGWVEQEKSIKEKTVSEFLDSNESWVIDGTYTKLSFDRRMNEADIIVIMALSRVSCLKRVISRYFKYRGRARASMTDGCNERINFEFLKWVFFDGRKKSRSDKYKQVATEYNEKTTIIKNQRQLNKFYTFHGIIYDKKA